MVCNTMAGYLCVLEDQHVEIPSACAPQNIPIESDVDVRALIDVDTIKYRAETDNRIVRKKHVYSVLAKCTGRARKDQLFPNVAGCSEKRFGNYAGALK